MNIKAATAQLQEIAEEALFQMDCDREYVRWMGVLMRAIRENKVHGSGSDVLVLAEIGQYLADGRLSDAEVSAGELAARMAALEAAK